MIKKKILASAAVLAMMSMMPTGNVMTREGKTTIINTTSLARDVEGYNGQTPLKIYIENNKIVKVEALPNNETPKYFAKVKKNLLVKWVDMPVNKAAKAKIDGVTGATFSSKAVKENVKRGVQYYKKNKKH